MTDATPLLVRSRSDIDADRRSIQRRHDLDGRAWIFHYRFSRFIDLWSVDILSDAGTPLVCGLALVQGCDIIQPYHHLDIPAGVLFVRDKSKAGIDAGLDGFDSRCELLYVGAS